jgi:hypothetical protein
MPKTNACLTRYQYSSARSPWKTCRWQATLVTFKHLGTLQTIQTQSMGSQGTTRRGNAVFVFLVCLLIFGQSASLAAQFESHHADEHCCLLCHVGALPFLQVAVVSTVAPVFRKVWFAPCAEITVLREAAPVICSSRAPPSSALLA